MNYYSHSMKLLFSAALFFALMLSQRDCCLAQTWSGNGPDSNWSTASNWVGGVAPVSSNLTVVTFDDPTSNPNPFQNIGNPFVLTRMDINSTAGAFSLGGQAIEFDHQFGNFGNGVIIWEGSNPINVSNDWILKVNTFATSVSGPGNFELTHSGDIRGPGNFTITQGRRLISTGTMSGTGRVIVGGLGAELTINGTVANSVQAIQIGEDGNFAQNAGWLRGSGVINSNVTAANGLAQSNRISSTGTMTINGNIDLAQGDQILSITEGAIVLNGSANVTPLNGTSFLGINNGTVLSGTGGISITGNGQLEVNGLVAASNTIVMNGSAAGGTFGSLMFGSGTIDAASTMNGGSVTGNLTIKGEVTILVANTLAKVTSYGTNATGGNVAFSRSNLTTNGTVTFDATGASGSSNSNLVQGVHNGSGRFVINSGNTVNFIAAEIGSNLTVDVLGRVVTDVTLSQPSVFNGTMNLASGRLSTSNTTFNGQINSTGNSLVDFATTSSNFNGLMNVQSGTLTIGGIMQGTGSMTILEGSNQTHQNSNSRMRLTLNAFGNLVGTAGARYENTVNLLGATMSGPLTMDGAVNVGNNEISNLLTGSTMTVAGLTSINDGTLRVASGATLTGSGSLIVNLGALDVQGTVIKNVLVEESGYLRGIGEVEGMVDVNGFLDPGNSAGTIRIRGAVDLKSTSTVCIEIGGREPGIGHDVVQGMGSNSTLNLGGGQLMLSLINGFVPQASDRFDMFVGFSSITGSFGGPDGNRIFFSGGSFAIEYGESSIGITDFQAVPEPTALSLVVLAVVPLLRRRRSC